MKFILSFLGVGLIVVAIIFCGQNKSENNSEYMRIHITANSNSAKDENIKYIVKDVVITYLDSLLNGVKDEAEAEQTIIENLDEITSVANAVLQSEGVNYCASVGVEVEMIPTRKYGDLILEQGNYSALQIELGEAKGGNWWCVVFPSVCFVDYENFKNVEYISKIWDTLYHVKT